MYTGVDFCSCSLIFNWKHVKLWNISFEGKNSIAYIYLHFRILGWNRECINIYQEQKIQRNIPLHILIKNLMALLLNCFHIDVEYCLYFSIAHAIAGFFLKFS